MRRKKLTPYELALIAIQLMSRYPDDDLNELVERAYQFWETCAEFLEDAEKAKHR